MLHGLRLFWSSTKENPFPRMLALDPKTLVKAASQDELMKMHLGLILAGFLSDRVWLWPLLDCSGLRAHQSNDAKHWTGVFDNRVLPYGGPADLKCIDLDLTWNYCMEVCSAMYADMPSLCVVIQNRFNREERDTPEHCPRSCSLPDPIRLVRAALHHPTCPWHARAMATSRVYWCRRGCQLQISKSMQDSSLSLQCKQLPTLW